jgi:hypothetical protein
MKIPGVTGYCSLAKPDSDEGIIMFHATRFVLRALRESRSMDVIFRIILHPIFRIILHPASVLAMITVTFFVVGRLTAGV